MCNNPTATPLPRPTTKQNNQVITVNQVVDIFARYLGCRDWRAALAAVLPERKVAGGAAGAAA